MTTLRNDKKQTTVFSSKNKLAKNMLVYFILSTVVSFFLYASIDPNKLNQIFKFWFISIELSNLVLFTFLSYFLAQQKRPLKNIFFVSTFILNGVLWGLLGSIVISTIATEHHVLILTSIFAIVAFGAPLLSPSTALLFTFFSSSLLLPPAIFFFSEANAITIGVGILLVSFNLAILKVEKNRRYKQKKTDILKIELQQLVQKLTVAVEETKQTNIELINEVAEKRDTEEALIKARDDAKMAAKTKSEFLATMSHEIRTPMNGILGMAELLSDTNLNKKQKRFSQTIHSSATSLLSIINDILDFSKIEAGKLDLHETVFDMRQLIDEIGVMFADQAHRKRLEIICHYPVEGHSVFRGDAERIRQILINLLGNAIKFTNSGEVLLKVEILEKSEDSYLLKLLVHDTGVGIKPSVQTKIFDAFSQADGSTTRKFGGTGLGLSICKKLTLLMSGEIGIDSEENVGSTFWLTLPLKKEMAVKKPIAKKLPGDIQSMRILIADASIANREMLEQQFDSWGLKCSFEINDRKALQAIKEAQRFDDPFELVIIDDNLPIQGGIDLAREIKNTPEISKTKIILLNSVGYLEKTNQWLNTSLEEELDKPISQVALYKSICKVLKNDAPTTLLLNKPESSSQENSVLNLKGHILVAEDNLVNQALVKEMILKLNCTLDIVGNGQKALEAVYAKVAKQQHPYDLILMDCQMPEMDGFEATHQLRLWEEQQNITKPVPIIALTANVMKGDKERCLSVGMNDYMSKPFNLEQIGALLYRWLPQAVTENNSLTTKELDIHLEGQTTQLDASAFNKLRELQQDDQPNIVVKVIRSFIDNSQKTVSTLESAISKGDSIALQRSAYSLLSSCSTVGVTELGKLCSKLEVLGRTSDVIAAQSLLSTLEHEYDLACNALKEVLISEQEAA